jgi:RND family efflux transporter MFP subunit
MDQMRIVGAAALALLLTACGAKEADAPEAEFQPVALVKTATAALGSTNDALLVYGTAEAGPGSELSVITPREAILVAVLAPNGTSVAAGAAIVTLRPSPTAHADYAKADSDAAVAENAYARARRLRVDGLASDADVETARAALTTAHATRASLGGNANGVTLRAPVAGTVQALTAKPGDQLAAGTAVATVAAAGERRARFGLDPAIARRVHPGQPIEIMAVDASTPIVATVAGVDPEVDATTRLASVFARVPANIGIGQPLHARISIGATATGMTIPYAALLDDGGQSFVFVVKGGVAKKQEIVPGNSAGDRIAVLRGLQPGERVVTEGGTALEDGMHVREAPAATK